MDAASDGRIASSPSSASSQEAHGVSSGPADHEDSPMRKRPRLDSKPSPDTGSMLNNSSEATQTSSSIPLPAPRKSSPRTANRVTLNLRNSRDYSSVLPSPSAPESLSGSYPAAPIEIDSDDSDQGTEIMDTTAVSPGNIPQSPPVAEIKLDDDLDEDEDDPFGYNLSESPTDRKIAEFPTVNDMEPRQALDAHIIRLNERNPSIDASYLRDIACWMADWLQLVDGRDRQLAQYYTHDHDEFWAQLSLFLHRLLLKKTILDGFDISPRDRRKLIQDFFCSYAQICGHFAHIDATVLQISRATSKERDTRSVRHIRNLHIIFRNPNETGMWKSLFERYSLDASIMLRNIARNFCAGAEGPSMSLLRLATISAARLQDDPELHALLWTCTNALASAVHFLRAGIGSGTVDALEDCLFGERLAKALPDISAGIIPTVDQQNSTISIAFHRDIVDILGSAACDATALYPFLPHAVVEQLIDQVPSAKETDYPSIAQFDMSYRLLWRSICKGRMELRVCSIDKLQDVLVKTWSQFSASKANPTIVYIANILVRDRVVEYLVSVDSHPQLVTRSSNITCFLFITQHWTPSMTNAIFTTISSSQDSGMVSAVVELLRTSLEHASLQELLAFCIKLNELKLHMFKDKVLLFLKDLSTYLGHRMLHAEELSTVASLIPLQLCLRLLCDAHSDPTSKQVELADVRDCVTNVLVTLCQQLDPDGSARKEIFAVCIENLQERNSSSTGSAETIDTLLCGAPQDIDYLCRQLHAADVVAREFVAFVKACRIQSSTNRSEAGLHVRLGLLQRIAIQCSDPLFEPELEIELLESLVGKLALNNVARDAAWAPLRHLVTIEDPSNQFIQRCIVGFLPDISPEFFTTGLVDFVKLVVYQRLKTHTSTSPEEGDLIAIPLGEMLWRIILAAPNPSVAEMAVALLSHYHLDTELVKRSSASSIAKTHTGLVERCIEELKALGRSMIGSSQGGLNEELPSSANENAECRLLRALRFLEKFLADVRTRGSLFSVGQSSQKSPSPERADNTTDGQDVVEVSYQTFSGNLHSPVNVLQLNCNATFADLQAKLLKMTCFLDMRTFLSGQRLDLLSSPGRSVHEIAGKGLLLVHNRVDRNEAYRAASSRGGKSVAENTVLDHLDDLLKLLNLPDRLSQKVFAFLKEMPPNDHVKSIVVSDTNHVADLFPLGKPYRTQYTLESMKKLLDEQAVSPNADSALVQRGLKTLIAAGIGEHSPCSSWRSDDEYDTAVAFIDCLDQYIQPALGNLSHDNFDGEGRPLLEMLLGLLRELKASAVPNCEDLTLKTFRVLLRTCVASRDAWETYCDPSASLELHSWLLLEHSDSRIKEHVAREIMRFLGAQYWREAEPRQIAVLFYWTTMSNLIPRSAELPQQCHEFYELAFGLTRNHAPIISAEMVTEQILARWCRQLRDYKTPYEPSREVCDFFFRGLARLVSTFMGNFEFCDASFSPSDCAKKIFDRLLFPRLTEEMHLGETNHGSLSPILHSDTRKELYRLVLMLCDQRDCFAWLVTRAKSLTSIQFEHTSLYWETDPSSLTRSSTGYSGLRNLTNTCYMNSLLTQLFMNRQFRSFIMDARLADDRGSQRLLSATKELFAYLQNSKRKFVDTYSFASTIVPYDAPQIDINVQMDVDEFYNLIFDRWEAQMLTKEEKDKFRSLYGGQIITQIKSLDCEHVSERVEPFLAISCEVKGKIGLEDSLKAYVQGDAMEGDNKYKCESCDGRFVNAVKRSCLRNVPDNVIFHLKRFDFDLITLQRSKINDKFQFPLEIDLAPFKYAAVNNPDVQGEPDVFELVGVLVHNGTAEAGHYYSFIRSSSSNSRDSHQWLEFNDIDVTEFQESKIPDHCFGGLWEEQTWSTWPKPYSAYMLFYERKSSQDLALGGVMQLDRNETTASPAASVTDQDISRQNETLIRWSCLIDPAHAYFVELMLAKWKRDSHGKCSEDHKLEQEVTAMTVNYLDEIASRTKGVPDFERILIDLEEQVSKCVECCYDAVLCLADGSSNPDLLSDLLLRSPASRVRLGTAAFLQNTIQRLRDSALETGDMTMYGVDVKDHAADFQEDEGALCKVVSALKHAANNIIGKHARYWGEYFALWNFIARLGLPEMAHLLYHDVFTLALELLFASEPTTDLGPSYRLYTENVKILARARKNITYSGLIQLVEAFVKHVDVCSQVRQTSDNDRIDNYDQVTKRFPVTPGEHRILNLKSKRQLVWLTKVIDAWTVHQTPFVPGTIVADLIEADPNEGYLRAIRETLTASIEEYLSTGVDVVLKTALEFCFACDDAEFAVPVIETAAAHARTLERPDRRPDKKIIGGYTDFESMGGHAYLDFFMSLHSHSRRPGDRTDGGNVEIHPFMLPVIRCAHVWAPPLLTLDMEEVRLRCLQILERFIFRPIAELAPWEDPVTNFDLERIFECMQLFHMCASLWKVVYSSRMPRVFAASLYQTLDRCQTLLQVVYEVRKESDSCQAMVNQVSEVHIREILNLFKDIEARHASYATEDDGPYADTEDASEELEEFEEDDGYATNEQSPSR